MGDVNAQLKELFAAFVLDRTPQGVRVLPVLHDRVLLELVIDREDWARLEGADGPLETGFPTVLSGAEGLHPLLRSVTGDLSTAGVPGSPLRVALLPER